MIIDLRKKKRIYWDIQKADIENIENAIKILKEHGECLKRESNLKFDYSITFKKNNYGYDVSFIAKITNTTFSESILDFTINPIGIRISDRYIDDAEFFKRLKELPQSKSAKAALNKLEWNYLIRTKIINIQEIKSDLDDLDVDARSILEYDFSRIS